MQILFTKHGPSELKRIDCNSGGTQAEARQPRVMNGLLHMFGFKVVSLALLSTEVFLQSESNGTSCGLLPKFEPFGKQQIK